VHSARQTLEIRKHDEMKVVAHQRVCRELPAKSPSRPVEQPGEDASIVVRDTPFRGYCSPSQ
jgi:hypothetical protein